jgi:hypothetical protein
MALAMGLGVRRIRGFRSVRKALVIASIASDGNRAVQVDVVFVKSKPFRQPFSLISLNLMAHSLKW